MHTYQGTLKNFKILLITEDIHRWCSELLQVSSLTWSNKYNGIVRSWSDMRSLKVCTENCRLAFNFESLIISQSSRMQITRIACFQWEPLKWVISCQTHQPKTQSTQFFFNGGLLLGLTKCILIIYQANKIGEEVRVIWISSNVGKAGFRKKTLPK